MTVPLQTFNSRVQPRLHIPNNGMYTTSNRPLPTYLNMLKILPPHTRHSKVLHYQQIQHCRHTKVENKSDSNVNNKAGVIQEFVRPRPAIKQRRYTVNSKLSQ
ncbi:hypothetical protein KC19_VG298200 [Ceratodon purpureus]|uniref:Uncharacterized protein n=1 Tax=Ceratodon purpureus TaxID=3225 RepID=A0A8T0HV41_CERPU|nr:hypothetical protein KC19_VG298200 [Ceratodon purpureus]